MPNKITPIHKAVADNYLANGGNKTKAYQSVYPNAKSTTAKVAACNIFKKDEVISYIDQQQNKVSVDAIASREFLIKEAHEIGKEAREAKAYVPAMKGIELKAKLNGVFDKERDDHVDYGRLMQTLIINGNVNINTNNDDTIDITPNNE